MEVLRRSDGRRLGKMGMQDNDYDYESRCFCVFVFAVS